MKTWDYIVIGLGAFGASSLYELAKQGYQVLGLDAHQPGDQHTLSYGQTRLFRKLYLEDESFIPDCKLVQDLWFELEQKSGLKIVHTTGHHYFYSPEKKAQYQQARAVAKRHDIELQVVNELQLFEPEAMVIDVDAYYQSLWRLMEPLPVTVKFYCPVLDLKVHPSGVEVRTAEQVYHAKQIVLSAGQWTSSLLSKLGMAAPVPLRYERAPVLWFQAPEHRMAAPICVANDAGYFFAIPNLHSSELKIFNYFPSQVYRSMDQHQREFIPGDEDKLISFAKGHFDLDCSQISKRHVCLFHSTPNEHFLMTHIVSNQRILVASGDSGHAFKFAPLLGRRVMSCLMNHSVL